MAETVEPLTKAQILSLRDPTKCVWLTEASASESILATIEKLWAERDLLIRTIRNGEVALDKTVGMWVDRAMEAEKERDDLLEGRA